MSKPIRMTPQMIEEIRADFESILRDAKLADGKLSFSKTFSSSNEKAKILYTPEAMVKMTLLLHGFSSEVGWYGVASRVGEDLEDETERKEALARNEYLISDILVYPQEVTGSTVDFDETKVGIWLAQHISDPRFYDQETGKIRIHMHGHSHVNMSTGASGVDLDHQRTILSQLPQDGFYIFQIWNKRLEFTSKIYDIGKNIMFDSEDISVGIAGSAEAGSFLEDAKKVVTTKSYSSGGYQSGGYNGYNGYYGCYREPYQKPASTPAAEAPKPAPLPPAKTEEKKAPVSSLGDSVIYANLVRKKKSEKTTGKNKPGYEAFEPSQYYGDDEDDDDEWMNYMRGVR